jgi:hypothetical protein
MAKTTVYTFVNGPETATIPAAGTPTDNSDVATKAYVDANSGGGGGSPVVWHNDSGDSPLVDTKYGNKVWAFVDGESQNLYCTVKVPQSYNAGSPIKIRVNHFHEAASATQLLMSQSTLIEMGDAFDNTSDQRTSTNSAVTAASKVITESVCDLTDSSGQVNGNAVAAGDLIKVRLYRGTDTSTSDVYFIESASEVTFA